MKLEVIRERPVPGADYIEGKLYINGVLFCYTLEDQDRELEKVPAAKQMEVKVHGRTCIPRGRYQVVVDFSQKFGKLLPRVLGVPAFTGIRFHGGVTAAHSDGCVLVGLARGKPGTILNGVAASTKLTAILEAAMDRGESIELEVS